MAGLIPNGRSAWFSLSTPETKKNIWFENGGRLEPDPFEADFLFAEDSEALDVQRIFDSEEFLSGHLTVFHSDIIIAAAKEEVASIDVMKAILLPERQLNELGIEISQSSIDDHRDDKTHKNNNSSHLSESGNSLKNSLRSSSKASSKNHPTCETAQPKDQTTNTRQKDESLQRLETAQPKDQTNTRQKDESPQRLETAQPRNQTTNTRQKDESPQRLETAQPKNQTTNTRQKDESPQRLASTSASGYSVSSTSRTTSVCRDQRASTKPTTTQSQTPETTFIGDEISQQTNASTGGDFSESSAATSVVSMNEDQKVGRAVSEKLKSEVPKIIFVGEERSLRDITDSAGGPYFTTKLSSTPNESSVNVDGFCTCSDDDFDLFNESLTPDIIDVADVNVPRLLLKDFIPGLDGCRIKGIQGDAVV
ncbi:uncharacterized protein LOC114522441 [Dendronephthya gigantea]|uniref:uncharacterized protein LOC114522441 n=1 Tax=Dendronephthya gigantea TaxID=151771 RepID=UPI00106A2688|nr:uncharacterized protein LOC114522441 [Dendronephthya gigantea]